jgi:hypothetical protein
MHSGSRRGTTLALVLPGSRTGSAAPRIAPCQVACGLGPAGRSLPGWDWVARGGSGLWSAGEAGAALRGQFRHRRQVASRSRRRCCPLSRRARAAAPPCHVVRHCIRGVCIRSQHTGRARPGRPSWRSAGAPGLHAQGRPRSHVPGIAFERFASAINAWDGVSPFAGLRGPSTPRQRRFGAGNPSNSPPRSAVLCERPIWAITDFVGFSAYAGYPKDWPTGGAHLVIPANAGIHDLPLSRQLEVVDTGIRRHDGGHRWRVDHSDTRYYSAILDRSYGAPSTGRSIWRAGAEDGMIRCRRAAAEHPSLSGSARIMPPPALSRTLPAPPEPPPVPGP